MAVNTSLVYLVTASNSDSVGKGFVLSKYFSSIRHVVSSTAVTLRSPGASRLRLLYLGFKLELLFAASPVDMPVSVLAASPVDVSVLAVAARGVGVWGSSVVSNRNGDDSKRRGEDTCEKEVVVRAT